VKIAPTAGTGGPQGLSPGGGIVVSFSVVEGSCNEAPTMHVVSLAPDCIVLHEDAVALSATLTSDGTLLSGKTVEFKVDGVWVGDATTGANGIASLVFDPSDLGVGNHTVYASFQGEQCAYEPVAHSATLGVRYDFLGYQPPVAIDGAGVGLFSGKVIPVKIKIADANGDPVPDADAYLYFALTTASVITEEAEPIANTNADSGNKVRYDYTSDECILNWDVSKLVNGYHC
jgi:hypothetical protein